ncbi:MAG: hypothetical protein HYV03_02050 [Deltaproteobacteria bacterium]|nr:hypothetical protein [Deltaproteobacteria bacterium]
MAIVLVVAFERIDDHLLRELHDPLVVADHKYGADRLSLASLVGQLHHQGHHGLKDLRLDMSAQLIGPANRHQFGFLARIDDLNTIEQAEIRMADHADQQSRRDKSLGHGKQHGELDKGQTAQSHTGDVDDGISTTPQRFLFSVGQFQLFLLGHQNDGRLARDRARKPEIVERIGIDKDSFRVDLGGHAEDGL